MAGSNVRYAGGSVDRDQVGGGKDTSDWFREMVTRNTNHIERLDVNLDRFEQEFSREFVRKDEINGQK